MRRWWPGTDASRTYPMISRWPLQIAALLLATLFILMLRIFVTDATATRDIEQTTPTAAPLPAVSSTSEQTMVNLKPTLRRSSEDDATATHTPANPAELPATAWTKVSRLQGRHAMPDFLEVFSNNLPSARAGDPDAMVTLAFAIGNCHMAASFRTRAELDAFAVSRPFAAAEDLAAMAALIPDCRIIANEVPEGMRIRQWSADWLQRAADDDHALARYLMVNQWERSDVIYAEAANALAEAVATGNPWALREAAEFVSNHPPPARDDPYQVEASAWLVLACREDPACDGAVLDQQIRWAQLPAYADQIMQRAARIRRQLDAGEPFDFDSGWRAQ